MHNRQLCPCPPDVARVLAREQSCRGIANAHIIHHVVDASQSISSASQPLLQSLGPMRRGRPSPEKKLQTLSLSRNVQKRPRNVGLSYRYLPERFQTLSLQLEWFQGAADLG